MSPPTRLVHHRIAVCVAFGVQGAGLITLTTRLPVISERWDLGELKLSVLLLMMILLAGVGSVIAERAAARRPSALLLRCGLIGVALGVAGIVLAPGEGVFVGAMALYGLALGVVDAASNMQAVALEAAYRRPILPSFHGAWTLGGMLGAGFTLATAHLPLAVAAVVAVLIAVAALAPFLARSQERPRPGSADGSADDPADDGPIPWRPIVMVGVAMLIFYLVDTASTTWGATYLDRVFDTPDSLVALATFPYLAASLAARFLGDRVVGRLGAVRVLRTGALVGAAGLLLVVTAPSWPLAVLGFTVTGFGVAVVAPLSFSAAAQIAGGSPARVDAVIGRFNQFNYAGALGGSVLTGVVGSDSLRYGFVVPAVLVLALIPLAKYFAPSPLNVTPALGNRGKATLRSHWARSRRGRG
ncbi:MFS transporter [Nocardioides dubius]|uniref:MFS transporter n=1 Tax=Nocardioides dubius TaxID=317019 RepID=A0ABN1TZI0_9ACTN